MNPFAADPASPRRPTPPAPRAASPRPPAPAAPRAATPRRPAPAAPRAASPRPPALAASRAASPRRPVLAASPRRRALAATFAVALACTAAAVAVASPASPATAATALAAAGCKVDYQVTSQWPGGFGASVAITNLGDAVSSWTLAFTFPGGQTVTQLWNGVHTQSGANVTVRNAAWNGSLATNATTTIGFNGSGSGAAPTSFAVNGTTCTGSAGPTTPPPAGSPVRIMPLGDSITGSPGCWRALLWQQLPADEVDFVGTLPGQGCGFAYDGENEGHGGYLATNIANQDLLPGWLAATDPDVVLMHLGTNDVWSNIAPATILAAFTKLVGQMRAANPAMRIIVAQIIPMNPSTCPECAQRVAALNAAIPAWAAGLTTAASPITVVDQWTGFDTATDTYDGVHPGDAGNVKIAARWLPAVQAVLP
ncbi:cellulose binding domain-containing protein [Actinoplanes sp. RD1]|uniref:cellulose binding domain-containing protein n=1 Tax=Actinoplanes sp. RD1 TaxID=3064538 RepID=UPI002740F04D|nr:cellulose binding domain-containing protein [Actinoplanes sp. RD1]